MELDTCIELEISAFFAESSFLLTTIEAEGFYPKSLVGCS